MIKGLLALLDPVDGDAAMSDEAAWDKIVDFIIRAAGALCLGALIYIDMTILDIPWTRSVLASLIVIACVIGRLGVWTIRKLALALTLYALAYLVGAVPPLQAIGDFLTRRLG